jgi:hypothetical protein
MTAPTTKRRAICPICGEQAIREVTKSTTIGIIEASFICRLEHGWITKWLRTRAT